MPKKKICISDFKNAIRIVQRSLISPLPGSASPRYEYVILLRTRAKVKTRGEGSNSFTQIQVKGKKVSHEFIIRYTATSFEADARVEFSGRYFEILGIENVNEENRFIKISCKEVGNSDVEASQ